MSLRALRPHAHALECTPNPAPPRPAPPTSPPAGPAPRDGTRGGLTLQRGPCRTRARQRLVRVGESPSRIRVNCATRTRACRAADLDPGRPQTGRAPARGRAPAQSTSQSPASSSALRRPVPARPGDPAPGRRRMRKTVSGPAASSASGLESRYSSRSGAESAEFEYRMPFPDRAAAAAPQYVNARHAGRVAAHILRWAGADHAAAAAAAAASGDRCPLGFRQGWATCPRRCARRAARGGRRSAPAGGPAGT